MMLGSDAILWGDSDVFIEAFGAIRSGRFLDHDPYRTLLYPYFLTAFMIWSGEPPMDLWPVDIRRFAAFHGSSQLT